MRTFWTIAAVLVGIYGLSSCGDVPSEREGIDETKSALCTQPLWNLAGNFTFEPATTTSNPHLPGSDANGVASANASSRLVPAPGGTVWYFTRNGALGQPVSIGNASCTGAFVQQSWPGNGSQKIVNSPYAMSGCQMFLINATNFDCTFPNGTHRIFPPGQWAIYKTQPQQGVPLYLDYDLYFEGSTFVIYQGVFGHI